MDDAQVESDLLRAWIEDGSLECGIGREEEASGRVHVSEIRRREVRVHEFGEGNGGCKRQRYAESSEKEYQEIHVEQSNGMND